MLRAFDKSRALRDRFDIVRELGAGGMGVVFEALDREQQADVAVKTLQSMSAESLLRFKHEFRALQDVHHDNLVRLGELFEDEGVWFFTMELVRGVDLFEHVCARRARDQVTGGTVTAQMVTTLRGKMTGAADALRLAARLKPPPPRPSAPHRFDEKRLRAAMHQLSRALVALHRARKVHRDVKPSNLLVEPEGRVVVLDFGVIADAAGAAEREIVGTAAYMAPEQACGEAVGPAADWYAVGAVLYLLLTGTTPFVGSIEDVLTEKVVSQPPRPASIAPDLPPDLEELCVRLLATEPSARPRPEEILRALGEDRPPPDIDASGAEDVFVGRARELDEMRRALEGTRDGRASLLLVSGTSGVGKSALVKRFLGDLRARERRTVIFSGRCYERESVPYKAVDEALDGVATYLADAPAKEREALIPRDAALLARVFPVLGRVPEVGRAIEEAGAPAVIDAQQMRARVFAALRELLGRLARDRRVVVSIDDLQWADADSLALLTEVLRAPDPPPLLVIATSRQSFDGTGHRSLAELATRLPDAVRELHVDPLPKVDALSLIAELRARGMADGAAPPAEAIAAEAAGHPMFISALVRHGGALRGGVHLDDVLWARVAELEPAARTVLKAVALAGAPIPQGVAAQAAGVELADFVRAASALRGAQFVRTTGARPTDTIEPYHDRVRETVATRTEADERRGLHRRLAEALEARGVADAEALASHWLAAGERPKALVNFLAAAERAASVLAFDRSARLYERAIELLPDADDRASQLQTLRGDALANAGRGRDAADAYLAAVRDHRSIAGLELRRRAAEQLLRSGHMADGVRMTREVLSEVGISYPRTPTHALVSLLVRRAQIHLRGFGFRERAAAAIPPEQLARIDICWTAAIGLGMTDMVRGNDIQTRQLLLALRAGEPYRVAKAIAVEAGYRSTAGHGGLRTTTRIVALAKEVAERTGNPHAVGLAILFDGYRAFLSGQWADGARILDAAEQHLRDRCTGVAWELTNAQLLCGWSLGYLGELDVIAKRVPANVHEARERGDLFTMANLRNGLPNIHWLVRDDPEGAKREVDEAMSGWSEEGSCCSTRSRCTDGPTRSCTPAKRARRRREWIATGLASSRRCSTASSRCGSTRSTVARGARWPGLWRREGRSGGISSS